MTSAGTKQLRAQSRAGLADEQCKWAVSAMESTPKNTPFQYVASRKESSLLGRSQQTHSINCPLMSRRRMRWRPDVVPACIKHHLLKTLSIYLYRLWQSCKYLCRIFLSFEEGVYPWSEALKCFGCGWDKSSSLLFFRRSYAAACFLSSAAQRIRVTLLHVLLHITKDDG